MNDIYKHMMAPITEVDIMELSISYISMMKSEFDKAAAFVMDIITMGEDVGECQVQSLGLLASILTQEILEMRKQL